MSLQQTLQNIGLEEKEAKTYLALLGLGETTATKLAEKTNLDRTLMYQLTNKLIEKGLASFIIKNNVRYFSPAQPETILKDLEKKTKEIKQALPELKSKMHSMEHETKIEVFRGREGIITLMKMIVRECKDYYFFGGANEASNIFSIENEQMVREATKKKISGKLLVRKNDEFKIGKNEDYRIISDELLSSTTLFLWGNKTAIMVWKKPYYGILINNKEITDGNLATFNYLWKIGEKPTKADRKKHALKVGH